MKFMQSVIVPRLFYFMVITSMFNCDTLTTLQLNDIIQEKMQVQPYKGRYKQ
jgi:hypothetical protein